MLITLECVILALQAVSAVRLALESPIEIDSQSNNRLSKRSPVVLGGGINKCYTMKVNVNGVGLGLRVDSAVSDTIVPLSSSSNDVSLTPQHTPSGEPVTIDYKGKKYSGISSTADVTIPGTEITDINLPVIAVGIDPMFNGVFGFGYTLLSNHHSRITAMDALYNGGIIPNNEVSLQLCPYEMLSDSFINIGNTEITAKCGTDGSSVAWVNSPSDDQFTVNIKSILVNDKRVNLPAGFQKRVKDGRTLYSVVETCCTCMHFPKVVVKALINAIVGSGAITIKNNMFRRKFDQRDINNLFWKHHLMVEPKLNIDWSKLPTLSIVMYAQNPVTVDNYNSIVEITLGPRDYMQKIDSERYLFAVTVGSNYNAALCIPFMTRLTMIFDRAHKRVGFGPGCGCEVSTDGYPIISNSDQVLWSPSQLILIMHLMYAVRLPEQPSTSSSDGRSTLGRLLSRLGSRRSKPNYEKFED
ncbi:hypothetical protein BATDEDRAFT_28166 [Batrachochytrium dendrobatidis JAM81]|uniref:Peptidase A1 domain-containing protein n=1 Tax=Batrachochytrium dendrobatidis (strain JAM81 / FGSC 10211) TaxID=684364 RepID=F4PCV8_BATDJ|nr:uncharacterized protein BATDEDRAFT_28166 [Batrachochytrium dendrobatidis JAM81]EGF77041.1 hypothetical protein BATDEDRAFT_28166 [Batrachochytrium dendrobatidis JAM81]|eukprot:XP_006682426.1 hypothetical protein BATDEDRAFT_28166 [Batrachochytrium dendrobatidis JAM81]